MRKIIIHLFLLISSINVYSNQNDDLFYYITRGDEPKVLELLNKGADPDSEDDRGRSALYIAIVNRRDTVGELLVNYGAEPEGFNRDGDSYLYLAIIGELSFTATALVNSGANPNTINLYGNNVLYLAIIKNLETTALALIRHGAEPNTVGSRGHVLLQAINYGMSEVAEELVLNGADVNIKDKNGYSALKRAEWRGCTKLIDIMKERGAK